MPPAKNIAPAKPLLSMRSYQAPVFWRDDLGLMLVFWRRQSGKSRTLAGKALRRMMEIPGLSVIYASASLNLGREFVEKEAALWFEALSAYRAAVESAGKRMETTGDNLAFDDFCELFEHQKFETKIWHSHSKYSRSKVIAPNVATARSWTGDVFLDEIGFIKDFRDLFAEMEPILSSSREFRCVMSTTPPMDDTHYSYELLIPPIGVSFPPESASAAGHWYESQAGIMVHRADAWDTALAGVPLFDTKTREPVTPEVHRARYLDRDNWDRSYGLELKTGGAAAVSLLSLQSAMRRSQNPGCECLAAEDDFPPDWRRVLGNGAFSIGADPATTEKEKSNPFSITLLEEIFGLYIARLIIRFKTRDPEKAKAYLREACDLGPGRKPRRLVVDATSERFWAAEVRTEFRSLCPVELLVASEKTKYQGEEMLIKSYLGNLLVNTMDDDKMVLPASRWVADDFRLVMRAKGSFDTRVDSAGNHGDTFESTSRALHGLLRPYAHVEASAFSTGGFFSFRPTEDKTRLTMRPRPESYTQKRRLL